MIKDEINPPDQTIFSDYQREVLTLLLSRFVDAKFSRSELMRSEVHEEILNFMASVFQSDADFEKLLIFVSQMVTWFKFLGLWFAYFLQILANRLQKSWLIQIKAALIYSDAQINLNHDLAFNSIEVAYSNFLKVKTQLQSAKLTCNQKLELNLLESSIKKRLEVIHKFYSKWGKPFDPIESNPLTENLHHYLTLHRLLDEFPNLDLNIIDRIEPDLFSVIEICEKNNLIYLKILALRTLGHWYLSNREEKLAIDQLKLAFQEAQQIELENEASHLSRLLGYCYIRDYNFIEGIHYLLTAYKIDAFESGSYWRALSARELGFAYRTAAILEKNLPKTSPDTNEPMKISLDFYRESRHLFESHLSDSSELPLCSAVKLQMFRCYSENAIDQALMMSSSRDFLEEIEFNSPRQVVNLVSEFQAVQKVVTDSKTQSDLLKTRAVFHKHLETIPERFENYLEDFTQQYQSRSTYLKQKNALLKETVNSQFSNIAVDQILNMRIPNTCLLLFNIGRVSTYAFIDMENGTTNAEKIFFTEKDLRKIQEDYNQSIKAAELDDEKMIDTIDSLLSSYEDLLNPIFEPIISKIENKHLKIFPRLQMNLVPLHAIKVNDKRLIDYCDVSYSQNLRLLLALQDKKTQGFTEPPLVVFNEVGTRGFLKGAINTIGREYKKKPQLLVNSSWQEFKTTKTRPHTKDVFFACHGNYDPNNPTLSYLTIGQESEVGFPEIFSSIDFSDYRSVVLAACESGLVKTDLAAEYLGLPSAFFASGTQYVIGSLWKTSEFPTAIIFSKYFELLSTGSYSIPQALNEAQWQIKNMSKDDAVDWTKKNLPSSASKIVPKIIKEFPEIPFSHPMYWAPFYVSGAI